MTFSDPLKAALKIILAYAAFSIAWFLFSDPLFLLFLNHPNALSELAFIKIALYIGTSSLLIFMMIYKASKALPQRRSALAEGKEHIALAMKATKTGTWPWDIKTNRTFWSDENYVLLGYEPGRIASHRITKIGKNAYTKTTSKKQENSLNMR